MRFFKSFSQVLHRRTRSDPIARTDLPKAYDLPTRPHSFESPGYGPGSIIPGLPDYAPLFTDTILLHAPSYTPNPDATAATRIAQLEAEVAKLKAANRSWARDFGEQQIDLMNTRRELYTERQKRHQDLDAANVSSEMEERLAQYSKFLGLMINIGLHEPVLDKTRTALENGATDVDEVLVEAIKEAAAIPDSPWARIMPAIVGPRTEEQYIAAVNMALKARKSLQESKRAAKWWKAQAIKSERARVDGLVTPSPSSISVVLEKLSPERQAAVDDLISVHRRSLPVSEHSAMTSSETITKVSDVTIPGLPAFASNMATRTPMENATACAQYIPNLPPLASESFKLELISNHSYTSLKRLSGKRAVLGDVDTNVAPSQSTKALGKRRVVAPSVKSMDSVQSMLSTQRQGVRSAGPSVNNITPFVSGSAGPSVNNLSLPSTLFDNSFDNLLLDLSMPLGKPSTLQAIPEDAGLPTPHAGDITNRSSASSEDPSDFSFAAQTISAPSTAPTSPAKTPITHKRELRTPVFRTIQRRLSPKYAARVTSGDVPVAPLVIKKKSISAGVMTPTKSSAAKVQTTSASRQTGGNPAMVRPRSAGMRAVRTLSKYIT